MENQTNPVAEVETTDNALTGKILIGAGVVVGTALLGYLGYKLFTRRRETVVEVTTELQDD